MTKEAAFQTPRSDRGPAIGMGLPPASGPHEPDQAYLEHAVVMRRVAIRKFRVPPEDADLFEGVAIAGLGSILSTP